MDTADRSFFFCGPVALEVINLLVRQFGPEVGFSLDVEQGGYEIVAKEGQHPVRKVKKAIFIGRVMNVVSVEVRRPFAALLLALH